MRQAPHFITIFMILDKKVQDFKLYKEIKELTLYRKEIPISSTGYV